MKLWIRLMVCVFVESVSALGSVCNTFRNGSADASATSCVPFQFAGMFVDFSRPLLCEGTVRSWSYCSNATGWSSAYLSLWRRSPARPNYLDRVYLQKLSNETVPRCPGALVPNPPVEVKAGDYLGLLVTLEGSPLPQLVCECVGGRLGFVQTLEAHDDASYAAALTWNESLFMPLDACLVGISAVVEPKGSASIGQQPAPSVPIVTSTVVPTSGGAAGSDLLSVVAATVAIAVSTLVLAGLAAMLCAAVVRRRQLKVKMGKSISVGNAIYAVAGCDTMKTNGGPIYDMPSTVCTTTMATEASYLGSEYEVGVSSLGSVGVASQDDHAYERATDFVDTQLHTDATYAVAGPSTLLPGTDLSMVPGRGPVFTSSKSFGHQYHLLEQVVMGEYVYDDVRPFQQPSVHEGELYTELCKLNVRRIPRGEISIVSPVGSGHFGLVNRGLWRDPCGLLTHEVAVKSLSSGSEQTSKVKFLQEAAIMAQFKHPNVVHLFGSVVDGDSVVLVLEYLHNGDLSQYLQQMRKRSEFGLPATMAITLLEMCQQVAFGMHYLCSKGFIHRDLAARNILVSKDLVCKIADFGLSRDLADGNYYVSKGGAIPVKWTAPEAVLYKKYSTASDVWGYGCLMYEVWSIGHKPFEGCDNVQVIQKVSSGYRLPPPPGCPRPVYKLMMACWHPDSTLRPMFRDILAILIGHNGTVLSIPDDIVAANTPASVLGAPLDASLMLYSDLQFIYNVCEY